MVIFIVVLSGNLAYSRYVSKCQTPYEKDVVFKSKGFNLYGTVSYPAVVVGSKKKFPAIVIVHGSGPNDRDGTFHDAGITLKPLKELARTLQKNGFIVLRYDKRTFTMIKNKIKVKKIIKVMPDDFIADARSAIDFTASLPQVDAKQVFLLGHSQGGSFAPFIVKNKKVKGVILLAPGLLPLREQIIYQLNYQIQFLEKYNTFGRLNKQIEQNKKMLAGLKKAFKMIDNGSFPKNGYIIGTSLAFFNRYQKLTLDVPNKIVAINKPTLLINGSKDLKCPAELVKAKTGILSKKKDLRIVYIDNMIHELYQMGTTMFEPKTVLEIVNWYKKLD